MQTCRGLFSCSGILRIAKHGVIFVLKTCQSVYDRRQMMALFDFGRKEKSVHLSGNARCCKCRKRIYNGDKYYYLKGDLYCENCGSKKLEDNEMIFALIMEDD